MTGFSDALGSAVASGFLSRDLQGFGGGGLGGPSFFASPSGPLAAFAPAVQGSAFASNELNFAAQQGFADLQNRNKIDNVSNNSNFYSSLSFLFS